MTPGWGETGLEGGTVSSVLRAARHYLALGLIVLLLGPAVAQAQQPPGPLMPNADAAGLSLIPPNVLFVRSAGFWHKDEKSGAIRMILARIGPAGSTPRLFVQWLSPDAPGGQMRLIAQQEITEVTDWRLRINDLRLETIPTGTMAIFEATPLPNPVERRYYLEIGGPEETRFYAQQ